VQAKAFDTGCFQSAVSFEELSFRKPVLGFFRFANNDIAFAGRAGIITKAQQIGQADVFLQLLDM